MADFILGGSTITADGDCSHEIKTLAPWKESYDQPRQHIKKQRHYFASKGLSSQNYGFSSSHVWMWELDYKESWAPKNWCFWTVVLEKTLESPLDFKEINPVHPKGNQSWIFIGRTDAEAETSILWPPGVKNWLIWKDPDAEKDWRQEEKGTTEDEMVGWHHRLDGHEFEQAPGVGDGQGGLGAAVPGVTKSQTGLNEWTELNIIVWSLNIITHNFEEKSGINAIHFEYYKHFVLNQSLVTGWIIFLCNSVVKNPAKHEAQVWSLGQEDPLE